MFKLVHHPGLYSLVSVVMCFVSVYLLCVVASSLYVEHLNSIFGHVTWLMLCGLLVSFTCLSERVALKQLIVNS